MSDTNHRPTVVVRFPLTYMYVWVHARCDRGLNGWVSTVDNLQVDCMMGMHLPLSMRRTARRARDEKRRGRVPGWRDKARQGTGRLVSGTCRGCVRTCRIRGLRRQFPRPGETRIQSGPAWQTWREACKSGRYLNGALCTSTQLGYLETRDMGKVRQGQGLSPRPPVQPPVPHLGVQSTTAPAPKWSGPHLAPPVVASTYSG